MIATVLVRNVDSDVEHLEFSTFSLKRVGAPGDLAVARELFPEAGQGEWLLRKEYVSTAAASTIARDMEDLLLLLRLYRPGDLTFVEMQTDASLSAFIAPHVGSCLSRPYVLKKAECTAWEEFAAPLIAGPRWKSTWFSACRRFFLNGGNKEFDARDETRVDRVIDYIAALEAALVHESDFLSRRLRDRTQLLLDLRGNADPGSKKCMKDVYDIRSTLIHGNRLRDDQSAYLRDEKKWWRFEELVREVIVETLRRVPADDLGRRVYLTALFDPADTDKAEQFRRNFKSIKDENVRRALLEALK